MGTKIAIKVNNEREFKALMGHYEAKGWSSWNGVRAIDLISKWGTPNTLSFNNRFEGNGDFGKFDNSDHYTIIDFHIFATIAGIEVEKEVVVQVGSSEARVTAQGVDLPGWHITGAQLTEIYTAYKSLGE